MTVDLFRTPGLVRSKNGPYRAACCHGKSKHCRACWALAVTLVLIPWLASL